MRRSTAGVERTPVVLLCNAGVCAASAARVLESTGLRRVWVATGGMEGVVDAHDRRCVIESAMSVAAPIGSRQRQRARPHALLGGAALSVVALWILLALLLPVPANAAVAPVACPPAIAQADLLRAGPAALPASSACGCAERGAMRLRDSRAGPNSYRQ